MGVYLSEINMPKGDGNKLVLQIFPNGEVYDEHGIRLGITNWAEAVPVPEHGDLINRNETIKALWKALYEYEDRTEKQFVESSELDVADWILHRIFVQNMSDIDRQTILQMPTIIPAKEGEA